MNKSLLFTIIFAIYFYNFSTVFAQCTPDANCTDTGNPGEICPLTMPSGVLNVPYNQVITVIPPTHGDVGGVDINVCAVKVQSVTGLPPGLTYACAPSNCYFLVTSPITSYCVLLSGTPSAVGTYKVKITVRPYINSKGCVWSSTEVVDSSLSITINPTASVNDLSLNKNILSCTQNPYSISTQISYFSTTQGEVELKIHDMLGNVVYKEKLNASIGDNVFKFTGSSLNRGVYIYTVSTKKSVLTKKLIKSN